MKPLIRIAHKASRETYGPRRIQAELQSSGTFTGRDRIARLRREMRIKRIRKRKFKATTNSAHSLPVVENLLDRAVDTQNPSQAASIIQEHIEVFYNRMRRHSALGNLAPAVFAENHLSERRSA